MTDDIHRCPLCSVPFKLEDVCADDITEGTCHAECLEGSPVVDLETGDEIPDGKISTYLYREVMEPRIFDESGKGAGFELTHEALVAALTIPPPQTHVALLDPHAQGLLAAQNNVIDGLMAENDRLRKMLAGCDWYWPEDDTSSEACADGPWQIAENCDVKPGDVFGYSRGGIVETRYYGFLDPAEDADSDDEFEADEPTREAAEAKIAAELQRRAALATTEGSDNG
ncbi:hypothetical protein IFT59_18650 [Rhizobium sp. CFBP 8752]|uniref:hypothetical protein n=1 Tax=Rhizobium sp. CFBP 8752 TaxID=2775301 RepID=UPI0017824888|nr:hypothetical protein [Rhizobium sp. CFBP 8752]MBD8665264.1 hypothetical protein [Rhizobium sp. CFBP 8752]